MIKSLDDLDSVITQVQNLVKEPKTVKLSVDGKDISGYSLNYDSVSKTWKLNFSLVHPSTGGYWDR